MNKHIEIEARWINLDKDDIEKKLKQIGAKKVNEFFFKEWIFQHKAWNDMHRRIRVRTDGKTHWLTYKANATWEIDSTEEVEVTVSSAEEIIKFLKVSDIPLVRYQEKKMIKYILDDITFELDFWPKVPMVLEIEASTKEGVKKGADLLELDMDKMIVEDQKILHKKYYDVDLDEVTDYKFKV